MYESGLKKFARSFVLAIFAIIVVILTYLCLFLNTYTSVDEKTTIVSDNPFKMIFYFIIVLIALFFIRRYYQVQKSMPYRKMFLIISVIIMIISIYVIFFHNIFPVADQQEILNAAAGLKNGNFSYFSPAGYVGKCTNQAGIVMILYYLSFIFGDNNYQVFQFLNIFGLLLSYYCICEISQISFDNDELKKWTLVLLALFIPLTWYIVFVYGNILGLAFSLYAVLCGYRYFEERKIKDIILSFIGITLSMMFKSNYSITFIAMVFFVIFDIILNKNYRTIILLILLVPAYFASSMIPNYLIKNKTGIELGKGIPMIAYVEMGLQDSPDSPGWFNGYNWNVYTNNGSDSDRANEQALNDLKNTLVYYLQNPKVFMDFIYRKTVSQWCNPDFQGTWLTRHSDFYFHNDLYYELMNILQGIILIGTLAYIYYTGRYMPLHRLLLPMIFIGGFVFHLFWEAKGQYTITYFVLLIPYCAKGLMDMTDDIAEAILTLKRSATIIDIVKHFSKRTTVKYILGLLVSCMIISIL